MNTRTSTLMAGDGAEGAAHHGGRALSGKLGNSDKVRFLTGKNCEVIMKRTLKITVIATIVMGMSAMALANPDPDTFSIDAISPSPSDPADLLNPGIVVQVPKVNLGLIADDELDALAGGNDAVQFNNIVFFSVDRSSQGIAGPLTPLDVNGQAILNQQAGDVFVTTNAVGTGVVPQGINMLYNNQSFYGEIPLISPLADNTGNPQDNLDAVSFEEFDLDGEPLTDLPTFFSLAAGSPSLGGLSAADILISPAGSGAFGIFATAANMGLAVGDDLDALALRDLDQSGTVSLGDMAMFSLAPGSPTLVGSGASSADVFLTTFNGTSAVRYPAASLGLLFEDNVDALEVQIPEPATLGLIGLGGVLVLLKRRRK